MSRRPKLRLRSSLTTLPINNDENSSATSSDSETEVRGTFTTARQERKSTGLNFGQIAPARPPITTPTAPSDFERRQSMRRSQEGMSITIPSATTTTVNSDPHTLSPHQPQISPKNGAPSPRRWKRTVQPPSVTPSNRGFWLTASVSSPFGHSDLRVALQHEQTSPGPGAYDALSSFPQDFSKKKLYLDRRNQPKQYSQINQYERIGEEGLKRLMKERMKHEEEKNAHPSSLNGTPRSGLKPDSNPKSTSSPKSMSAITVQSAIIHHPSDDTTSHESLSPTPATPATPTPTQTRPTTRQGSLSQPNPAPSLTPSQPTPSTSSNVSSQPPTHLMSAKERRLHEQKVKSSIIRIMSERLQTKQAANAGAIAAPALIEIGEEAEDDGRPPQDRLASPNKPPRKVPKSLADLAVHAATTMEKVDDIDPLSPISSAEAQIKQAQLQLAIHSSNANALDSGGLGSLSVSLAQFLRPIGPSLFEQSIMERWNDKPHVKKDKKKIRALSSVHGSGEEPEEVVVHSIDPNELDAKQPYSFPHSAFVPLKHQLASIIVQPFQPMVESNSTIAAPAAAAASSIAPFAEPTTASFSRLVLELQAARDAEEKAERHRARRGRPQPSTVGSYAELYKTTSRVSTAPTGQTRPSTMRGVAVSLTATKLNTAASNRSEQVITRDSSLLLMDTDGSTSRLPTATSVRSSSSMKEDSTNGNSSILTEFADMFRQMERTLQQNKKAQVIHQNALLANSLGDELLLAKQRDRDHQECVSLLEALTALKADDSHAVESDPSSSHSSSSHKRLSYGRLKAAMDAQERALRQRIEAIKRASSTTSASATSSTPFTTSSDSLVRPSSRANDILQLEFHHKRTSPNKPQPNHELDRPSTSQSRSNGLASGADYVTPNAALAFDPALAPRQALIDLLAGSGGVDLPDRIKRNLYSSYAKELPERVRSQASAQ